jgi:hypothetical protein
MRRPVVLTFAVLASITLMASGCTTTPGSAGPSASARPATQILTDAVAKTKGQSFTYTLTYGSQVTADGAQDVAAGNGSRNVTFSDPASGLTLKANLVLNSGALYAKVDLGAAAALVPGLAGVGSKYLTLDMKKINPSGLTAGLLPTADTITPGSYLGGVITAESVSPTQIKGTTDLSKSAPKLIPATSVAKLDATSKVAPFVVTLDEQGRITKVVLSLPKIEALPAADLTVSYAGYGSTVQITAPTAADTVPAPDLIYSFLP